MAELRRVGWVRARERVIQLDVGRLAPLHLLKPISTVLQTVAARAEEVFREEFGEATLARVPVLNVWLVVLGVALNELVHLELVVIVG